MIINLKMYENLQMDDPRRFYPNTCPVLEYEPLRAYFSILESPEDIRKGIVSLVTFNEEDLIANLSGFLLNFQTLHSLQEAEGKYIHDTFFSGFLLHSCDPNAELHFNPYSLHAIKKIKPFELVSIDYEKTEDYLYQAFDCKCGSPNCRRWISGKKARNGEK